VGEDLVLELGREARQCCFWVGVWTSRQHWDSEVSMMRKEEHYLTWPRALPAVSRDWLWKEIGSLQSSCFVWWVFFGKLSVLEKQRERFDLIGSLRLRLAEVFTSIHESASSLSHKTNCWLILYSIKETPNCCLRSYLQRDRPASSLEPKPTNLKSSNPSSCQIAT
jgi:hypothetical protein